MVSYLRKILIIFQKDCQEELHELNNFISTLLFALMLVFIFSFVMNLTNIQQTILYPSLIWIIILFTSVLGLVRSFAQERENDVIEALILASGDRSTIFFGKFLGNLILLFLVEVVVLPVFLLFSDFQGKVNLLLLGLTIILGSIGLSLLGTLLNSITAQIRGTQLLLPVLIFPISVPLLLAVIECTQAAFWVEVTGYQVWAYFLVVFDVIFILIPVLVFDFLLEV